MTTYIEKTLVSEIVAKRVPKEFLRKLLIKGEDHINKTEFKVRAQGVSTALAPWVGDMVGGQHIDGGTDKSFIAEMALLAPVLVSNPAMANNDYGVNGALKVAARNVKTLDDAISEREEAMLLELLADGKITQSGNGINKVIDFRTSLGLADLEIDVGAGNANKYWAGNAADIAGDIQAAINKVASKGRATPDFMLVPDAVAGLVRTAIKAELNSFNNDLGKLGFSASEYGALFLGEFSGLSIYSYNFDKKDRTTTADGAHTYASKKFLPSNKVIIGSSKAECTMVYGACNTSDSGLVSSDARVYHEWESKDNGLLHQKMSSRPIPSVDLESFVSLKVAAS